jgi:hypothetical protein
MSTLADQLDHGNPPHTTAAALHPKITEGLILASSVASLIVSCLIRSARRQQWTDEIFTRTEVSDPSFRHLFSALQHTGTGGCMPLFYLTGWPWAHIFGYSDLALRLYSSLGICTALVVLWWRLRGVFRLQSVALGILGSWYASYILLSQNAEGRYYGLYLAVGALAVAAWYRVAMEPHPRRFSLALLAVSQAVLVMTHVLALFYGALMLLALVLFDRANHRFRPAVYLCMATGWTALLLWVTPIRTSIAVGKPYSWIPEPSPMDLFMQYNFDVLGGSFLHTVSRMPVFGGLVADFLSIATITVLITELWTSVKRENPSSGRSALLFLGFALLAAPLLFFAISYVITPIFVARYMLPSMLGSAIVATSFAERHLRSRFWIACLPPIVVLPVVFALLGHPARLDVDRVDALSSSAKLPLVVGFQKDFFVMERYSKHPENSVYLLDWNASLRGVREMVSDYHLMRNYRDVGYFSSTIQDSQAFLHRHPAFLVLDDSDGSWFNSAIKGNPDYRWRVVAQLDQKRRLIAVQLRQGTSD